MSQPTGNETKVVDTLEVRRLSLAALADPRTFRNFLAGKPVRPTSRERIIRALKAAGREDLIPQERVP
jgi:hypothetical protein